MTEFESRGLAYITAISGFLTLVVCKSLEAVSQIHNPGKAAETFALGVGLGVGAAISSGIGMYVLARRFNP